MPFFLYGIVCFCLSLCFIFFCCLQKSAAREFKGMFKDMQSWGAFGTAFFILFASIKYANVAVGVVCYSLEGFFTAIFEPLIFKKPFSRNNLLCSIIAVLGISLIFHIDTRYRLGIILGVISAAMIAFYTIFNKVAGMGKVQKVCYFMNCWAVPLFLL